MAAVGVVPGSATAAVLMRFLEELLFGLPAMDPVTYIGVRLLLGGVAIVAASVPAWRAAAVSPMEAMGSE